MHQFSENSKQRLETCHEDLQTIFNEVIKHCPVDFGIAQGIRTAHDQQLLFEQGKSKCDGIRVKSKHQNIPSYAVDIYGWSEGQISYSNDVLVFLGAYILSTAKMLLKQRKISHEIRWGGNWDGDGIIKADQTFVDLPHFEIL